MSGRRRIYLTHDIVAILDGNDLILAQWQITRIQHRIKDQEMADETGDSFLFAAREVKARFKVMNCYLSAAQRKKAAGLVNNYPCGEDLSITVDDHFATLVRQGRKVFAFETTMKKQNAGVANFFTAIAEAIDERDYGHKPTKAEFIKQRGLNGSLLQ